MDFFIAHSTFLGAVAITLVLPGLLALLTARRYIWLSHCEIAVFSVPLSFIISTLGVLFAAKSGMPLAQNALFLFYGVLLTILFIFFFALARNKELPEAALLFTFSKLQSITIGVIVSVMLLIQGTFLTNAIFPTSTDLGHHMFWANKMAATGELPVYEKMHVLPLNPTNAIASSAEFAGTHKVADFIIGEHIIFAVITAMTGLNIVSAFPSLILYISYLAAVFALFTLALRLFAPLPFGKNAAIFALLLSGALWTVTGDGVKFVSGGVVGNILGNMLIITSMYAVFRAFSEKSRFFFVLLVLSGLTLILTHHLSTFILLYVVIFVLLFFVITQWRDAKDTWTTFHSILFNPLGIFVCGLFAVTLLLIHTPSYLNPESISGSVGTPTKSTRVGLPLIELMQKTGEARFTLGVIGLFITLLLFSKTHYLKGMRNLWSIPQGLNPYARTLILGWGFALILMTFFPAALKVNIISSRIATYLSLPLALTAGFALAWILHIFTTKNAGIHRILPFTAFAAVLSFTILTGIDSSIRALTSAPKTDGALQTFDAAEYLSTVTPKETWILKDHNYVTADTWMKIFIKGDYTNPLSRSFFQRYENNPDREHCTLTMISEPASALAEKCFRALRVGPIVVNTEQDAGQFKRSKDFIKVYENDDTSIFWRTTK